ncbi:aminoglycoside phosphotransferase family protein [Micromonospora azadirachtae]|uniref:Aminoglycoside phosphotransferase family protein n=1 Tax=Micromonospora azadirachtae TaxID=1970735 RepID=A0ABW2ZVX9_9ACTN
MHALLNHLRAVGFSYVPKPLAIVNDEEILEYIPGDSGPAGWARVVPEAGLRAFARLLRDYHQAVSGFTPPKGARWVLAEGAPEPGQVVCHGDFGPWNIVWDGLRPVGLVDFDMAEPGEPLDDIAYALEYVTPFRDDTQAVRWQSFTTPPNRYQRIEIFADEYGLPTVDGLVGAVIRRQRKTITSVRLLAERGLQPQRQWVADGFLDELAARADWTDQNRALFAPPTDASEIPLAAESFRSQP